MSVATIHASAEYTTLPDEQTLQATITALEHSLKLEGARAYAAYGQNSFVGKVREIRQEQPGRLHVVPIRQVVGF